MLGREPKDFDVVTDARPEEIRKLFRSARLIGRRFRLAHVRLGREVIEVATFRAIPRAPEGGGERRTPEGRLLDDNIFGSQEEDALRRDFTVNALYYDIQDFSVIDYVGGVEDLRQGLVRMIGDPETRYREDPVRLLRAVRFAAKLGFKIEPQTEAPIVTLGRLLLDVPPARTFEEVLKLFHGGYALETYELLRKYGLFEHLFPLTEAALATEHDGYPRRLVALALGNTDARIQEGKPVTPAFLFAALLWDALQERTEAGVRAGQTALQAMQGAAAEVLVEQSRHIMLPKRFSVPMREIWGLQGRFTRRHGNQAFRLLEHPRFRAAYDFLLLRAQAGEESKELGEWWTRFQEVEQPERRAMVRALAPEPGARRRRRRRRR